MRKILLVGLLTLASAASAGNYAQLNSSTKTLAGALEGGIGEAVVGVRGFIPGYGYQISALDAAGSVDPKVMAGKVATILKQLAPTVKGLDKNEYLSVIVKGLDRNYLDYELLVRYRGGKIERFLNGKSF